MEGEGMHLETENRHTGRIELPAGASLKLLTVDENPTFESLGPVRVSYKLGSTDSATKQLLPTSYGELLLEIPPTKLISTVWAARTNGERNLAQPSLDEFLRFRAQAQKDDEKDFQTTLQNRKYAA